MGSFVDAARTSLAKVMLVRDGSKSRVVALTELSNVRDQPSRRGISIEGGGKNTYR